MDKKNFCPVARLLLRFFFASSNVITKNTCAPLIVTSKTHNLIFLPIKNEMCEHSMNRRTFNYKAHFGRKLLRCALNSRRRFFVCLIRRKNDLPKKRFCLWILMGKKAPEKTSRIGRKINLTTRGKKIYVASLKTNIVNNLLGIVIWPLKINYSYLMYGLLPIISGLLLKIFSKVNFQLIFNFL